MYSICMYMYRYNKNRYFIKSAIVFLECDISTTSHININNNDGLISLYKYPLLKESQEYFIEFIFIKIIIFFQLHFTVLSFSISEPVGS